MADESLETSTSTSTSQQEKRRSTVPEILPHQKSFEKRYSHIINQQILETGINREVLQRQLNAYFPLSRSPSLQNEGASGGGDENGSTGGIELSTKEETAAEMKECDLQDDDLQDGKPCLEKGDTFDIEDITKSEK